MHAIVFVKLAVPLLCLCSVCVFADTKLQVHGISKPMKPADIERREIVPQM